jgi:hypothetical protein
MYMAGPSFFIGRRLDEAHASLMKLLGGRGSILLIHELQAVPIRSAWALPKSELKLPWFNFLSTII